MTPSHAAPAFPLAMADENVAVQIVAIRGGATRLLRDHRRASLADLASALDASPAALEGMLATLERKGRVRRLPAGPECGSSCCKCAPEALAVFEWIGG